MSCFFLCSEHNRSSMNTGFFCNPSFSIHRSFNQSSIGNLCSDIQKNLTRYLYLLLNKNTLLLFLHVPAILSAEFLSAFPGQLHSGLSGRSDIGQYLFFSNLIYPKKRPGNFRDVSLSVRFIRLSFICQRMFTIQCPEPA